MVLGKLTAATEIAKMLVEMPTKIVVKTMAKITISNQGRKILRTI
jgi:hypothetical protein